MDIINVYSILGVGGVAAIVAYWVFTWLGKNWLENRFAERLESLKHAQEREMEKYRYEINALFNRITKIQDKEFDVLPTAWQKLQEALGYVARLTSPMQFYPDFGIMPDIEFDEWLAKSKLTDAHKHNLSMLHPRERNDLYIRIIFGYDLRETREKVLEFHNYLVHNKIFLSLDLFKKFSEVDALLSEAISKRELGERARDINMLADSYKVLVQDEALINIIAEIESLVQKRLHYQEAT